MNWHASREDDYNSPVVRGMRRINPEEIKRTHTLNDNEIRALWAATDPAYPFPTYSALVRMLLLTAQRYSIVASMKWDDISSGGVWTIPVNPVSPLRRKKSIVMVQLPAMGRDILVTLPRVEGNPFVFATQGNEYIKNDGDYKRQLDARLPTTMRSWRHHDLRRTARTLMSRTKKVPREHAERTLGHTIGGIVESTYDCHQFFDEKTEALFQLAALLDEILHSGPAPVLNITTPKPRSRALSLRWQTVINMIAATGDVGVDIDQIVDICEKAGIIMKKRAHICMRLFQYTKRGRLVHMRYGRYMAANGGPS
jgi:integrase